MNATGYSHRAYSASDVLAVLDICVTPCMTDPMGYSGASADCCMVPDREAKLFPGCSDCRRRRRAQALDSGARAAQVSVTVAVNVQKSSRSSSVYDALLRCLQVRYDASCACVWVCVCVCARC